MNQQSNQQQGIPPEVQDASSQKSFFFLVAMLVYYNRDDNSGPKQRHLNTLVESHSPNISKAVLGDMQRLAMKRIHAEHAVEPDQILDIVIINISHLAHMSSDEFHGDTVSPPSTGETPTSLDSAPNATLDAAGS